MEKWALEQEDTREKRYQRQIVEGDKSKCVNYGFKEILRRFFKL